MNIKHHQTSFFYQGVTSANWCSDVFSILDGQFINPALQINSSSDGFKIKAKGYNWEFK